MVANSFRLFLALNAVLLFRTISYGEEWPAPVLRAAIIQCSSLSIKPCQSVTAVIDVEADSSLTESAWRRIVHQTSQVVRVNGQEFRNRLSSSTSSLNDAADFRLRENRVKDTGVQTKEETKHRQIIVTMFLNGRDRECMFSTPGRQRMEFTVGDELLALEVDVNEPTPQEHEIIESINSLPVLLFLLDPEQKQCATAETLSIIESLMRHDTAHKKMLSLARGLAREGTSSMGSPTSPDFEERRLAAVRERYEWLAPFCFDEITSRIEATAAFKCGLFAGMLAGNTKDSQQAERYLAQRVELWNKVADSPLAFGETARAKECQAKIKAEQRGGVAPQSE